MRFQVRSAIAIGLLLPVLETVRRGMGHWAIEFTTMFEDYLAGALLLVAATRPSTVGRTRAVASAGLVGRHEYDEHQLLLAGRGIGSRGWRGVAQRHCARGEVHALVGLRGFHGNELS